MSGEARAESTPSGWGAAIDIVDEKHQKAHERLRNDLERTATILTTLTQTVDRNYNYFVGQQASLQLQVNEAKALASRPVDGTALVWTTKTVVGVLVVFAGLLAGYWDLRTSVKAVGKDLDAARTETTKAITELKTQRESDRREAQDRLNQFLNQRLETALQVAPKK